MSPADRRLAFGRLALQARECRLCPRMDGRVRVLSELNGSVNPSVLFVAEAPGRLGADRTGIPLSSDRTGRNFDLLLPFSGLRRADVFITNAVLCNPRDPQGRNTRPSGAELRSCSRFLVGIIDLLQPPWVVSLGRVALDALALVEPHRAELKDDVGRQLVWYGRGLVPLYHPGPRSVARRGIERHRDDYRRLGEIVRGPRAV